MNDDRPLLSPADVAERLGIKERKTYMMLAAGEIPSLKIGRLVKVRPADLDAYVASRTDPPTNRRPT